MLEIIEIIELLTIGLFAGFVGGMLGVGGSIVMIPAMTEVLGPDQHLYQAAALIVNFFVVVPAVYQHRRAKAIDSATVTRIIPLAMVAVVAGVGISELPLFAGAGEAYLRGLFGLFLFAVAAADLYRLLRRGSRQSATSSDAAPAPADQKRVGWTLAAAIAIPTGLVSGLLGVGGGILAVPLQRRFLRIPIRIAIANSATIIIATSSVGSIAKNYAYVTQHDSLRSFLLAAFLIPTAMIGSSLGSRVTHRAPLTFVKVAFFVLLLVASVRLIYKAGQSLPRPASEAVITCVSPLDDLTSPDAVVDQRQPADSTFWLVSTDTTSKRRSWSGAARRQPAGVRHEQSTHARAMVSRVGDWFGGSCVKRLGGLYGWSRVPRGGRPVGPDGCYANRERSARRPVRCHRA